MNAKRIACLAVSVIVVALQGSPVDVMAAGSSSKGSGSAGSRRETLKPPKRNPGRLKATYDGRHDPANKELSDQRRRNRTRLSGPDPAVLTRASNTYMGDGNTTTSPTGTRTIASPVNEPPLRPARPKGRVSIDGIGGMSSTRADRPPRLSTISNQTFDSNDYSDTSSSRTRTGSHSSRSSSSSDGSFDSWGNYHSRPSPGTRSVYSTGSSQASDSVDRTAGEGTRPASVELNRLRRDPRRPNRTAIVNGNDVLQGERTPAAEGSPR